MTERPSETGHLTPEQLDELATAASSDLDPDQSDLSLRAHGLLERHLDTCARCRTALGDQVAVRRVLQRVPDPGPMPADLAGRLDAALASAAGAAASASASASASGPSAAATVVPLRASERRTGMLGRLAESRLTKSLVAAAAVGLIGLGGYAAVNRTTSAGSSSTASGAAKGSSGGSVAAPDLANRDVSGVRARASGTAYTKAAIASQVLGQLAATEAGSGTAFAETQSSSLATTTGLKACLSALGAPTAVPELVDIATFDGKPVAVIVLPRSDGGREIWVVSRTCSPGKDGTAYYALVK